MAQRSAAEASAAMRYQLAPKMLKLLMRTPSSRRSPTEKSGHTLIVTFTLQYNRVRFGVQASGVHVMGHCPAVIEDRDLHSVLISLLVATGSSSFGLAEPRELFSVQDSSDFLVTERAPGSRFLGWSPPDFALRECR
jgi:hypothetical protein